MGESLPIVESFHSIQGEGAHSGRSAFFIRLAGCKVGCSWCDTKYSWSTSNFPLVDVYSLSLDTAKARSNGAGFVVITGGEPLHHNLNYLAEAIRTCTTIDKQKPMPIHLETSGVEKITGSPDWITLSPKRHSPPCIEALNSSNEIKVVVHSDEDLTFAEEIASKIKIDKSQKILLFLQAGWGDENGQKLAVEYVKRNSNWRLSMQTHKWIGIE
tara:strand:+ start:950 stop:1591 length:642 start_codon:yes stop_codon:yes gene_type:complete